MNLIRQLVVEREEVRLYMDCGEAERATFHRGPGRLTFSHSSAIFVSNAGGTGLEKFVVSVIHKEVFNESLINSSKNERVPKINDKFQLLSCHVSENGIGGLISEKNGSYIF